MAAKRRQWSKMGLKIRVGLLICLVAAAAMTGYSAYSSIRHSASYAVPEEVYAQFKGCESNAEFYLRSCNGYVAVYSGGRERSPMTITDIEIADLRGADKALLANGIPVSDRMTLLYLLEDLGS